jgi:hypothetical protein
VQGGLFVYAPVAATRECLALLQPLIDAHGPVKHIVLPAVAVEHKVRAKYIHTHTHTHTYTHIHIHTHTHTYIHVCVCVCVW